MNHTYAVALDKFAASDLRAARREGYTLIGQTKRGTVSLTHEDGIYTLRTFGVDAVDLAKGKPAVVRPVLASLYVCSPE
jgi:hypothetical protein